MSLLLDSVHLLLQEVNRPVTPKELANELIQRKWWTTQGKTPWNTISAAIYSDIKELGSESRFVKTGRGTFALNSHLIGVSSYSPIQEPMVSTQDTPFLSFTDCAEKVLLECSDKTPMHYRDIVNKAMKMGCLKTAGQTPEATMRSKISSEIQRREQQGRPSRFQRLGDGMIGLTTWQTSGLEQQIDAHNKKKRKQLLERVRQLTPQDFEKLVILLLVNMGFSEVCGTPYSKDGGVDARGVMTVHDVIHVKLAVQIKRWKKGNNVQAPEIQKLRGALSQGERGVLVTASSFTKGAKDEACRPSSHFPIDLIDGEQLVSLLIQYDMGIRKNHYQLLELTPSFFSDEEEI